MEKLKFCFLSKVVYVYIGCYGVYVFFEFLYMKGSFIELFVI